MKNDQGTKMSNNKAQPAPPERRRGLGGASQTWDSGTLGRLFCLKLSHQFFTKKRKISEILPL